MSVAIAILVMLCNAGASEPPATTTATAPSLSTAPATASQVIAQVWTIEGQPVEGVLRSIAAGREIVVGRDGDARRVSWDDVDHVTILCRLQGTAAAGPWKVRWAGGVLYGQIAGGDASSIRFDCSALGTLDIPLERLERIALATAADRRDTAGDAASRRRAEDRVELAGGDVLTGSIVRLGSEGVLMLIAERERLISWKAVRALDLAALAKWTPPRATGGSGRPAGEAATAGQTGGRSSGARVRLLDGSTLVATALSLEDDSILLEAGLGRAISVLPGAVSRIEPLGGRRVWLDELPPASVETISYFDGPLGEPPAAQTPPAKAGASDAAAGPFLLGGQAHEHGLRSVGAGRWTWRLDGRYEKLRATVGIEDGSGPQADADVVVRVDGRAVAEHRGLRDGQPPRRIEIDLRGVVELTVEVGFGRRGPVQDRVVLVSSALIRAP